MSAILRAKRPDADDQITNLLDESDLHTSFIYLNYLRRALDSGELDRTFGIATGKDRFERLLAITEKRHGERAAILRPVFEHSELLTELVNKRQVVTEPDHRFFFALLLNLDDRQHIFELIRQRHPDEDAVEKILDWVFELSQTRILGPENANALGVQEFGGAEMFALEGLLREKKDGEIATEYARESAGGTRGETTGAP